MKYLIVFLAGVAVLSAVLSLQPKPYVPASPYSQVVTNGADYRILWNGKTLGEGKYPSLHLAQESLRKANAASARMILNKGRRK